MPKISVLMPIYKTPENYLREAIESILNQTYQDFEFLILDDCPENNREEIVKSYHDDRIKYSINEKNLGITPSRNKLIDMAEGEYLAIFDHDDISLPTRLEKEITFLDSNLSVGVVGSYVEVFQRENKLINIPTEDHEIKLALMSSCVVFHSASMIRKSVLLENGIKYEEQFSPAEDYGLWARLIAHTKFHNIPEVLFRYRDHGTNTSKTQEKKMESASLTIFALVQTAYPALYAEFLMKAVHTKRIRLFGFIPLISIVTRKDRSAVYLFDRIKLFTCIDSVKLKK